MTRQGEILAIERHGVMGWVAVLLCCTALTACGGSSSSGNGGAPDAGQPPAPGSEQPEVTEQPPAPDGEEPDQPRSEQPAKPDSEATPPGSDSPPPDSEKPPPADSEEPPAPTLTLTASPQSIEPGESSRLTWSSSNAGNCEASGGWSGSKEPTGFQEVGPIEVETRFLLSCSGGGGGVSRQVIVAVDDGNGPTVTLQAEPQRVAVNQPATLTWSSENSTSCVASGAWSGSRDTSGSFDTGPLSETAGYSLSCTGPSGNALASATIEVLDRTIRWQAPTQNVDGSPLTDLAGYVVHWGKHSRSYDGSHTIDNPKTTVWEVTVAPGTYFFALTAFDADGSESGYSNEVTKTIP